MRLTSNSQHLRLELKQRTEKRFRKIKDLEFIYRRVNIVINGLKKYEEETWK